MTVVTLKMPDALADRVRISAEFQHTSRSEIMRRALRKYVDQDIPDSAKPTAYDLLKDFVGSVDGSSDLSSNSDYMTGYGE